MKKSIIVIIFFVVLIISIIASLVADNTISEGDLIFSHKFHVEEAGAECDDCHTTAETSTVGTDDLLPKEENCMQCHDKESMECTDCHKSGKNPVLLQRIKNYSPVFNHSKHIAEGFKCNDCHAEIRDKEIVSGLHIPNMAKCMTCHETPDDVAGCYRCHGEDEDLKPFDHNEIWISNHGSFSESGSSECSTCHNESFCTDCHLNENLFNNSHPPEFILTHSISFMMRETDCMTCHTGYDFCIECHTEINYVKPVDHLTGSWATGHRTEAKTKVDVCIVCHADDDPECFYCHVR